MDLKNKIVLVTAGATYEPIDPVRFIGNRSTGKMGICIANVLLKRGAKVMLVLGEHRADIQLPVAPHLTIYYTKTALEMYAQCLECFPAVDLVIKTAAVSDYRPKHFSVEKIKKKITAKSDDQDTFKLELVKNPDILFELGQRKKHQKLVGFALETHHAVEYAQQKLQQKNLDAIVLNSLQDQGAGFGLHTNAVTFFDKQGGQKHFPMQSKEAIAVQICDCIEQFL